MRKYCYQIGEDEGFCGHFATRAEALAAGQEAADEDEAVWTGRVVEAEVAGIAKVAAERCLVDLWDALQDVAGDHYGEAGDNWPPHSSDPAGDKTLTEEVGAAICRWIRRAAMPDFYTVEDVQEHPPEGLTAG